MTCSAPGELQLAVELCFDFLLEAGRLPLALMASAQASATSILD